MAAYRENLDKILDLLGVNPRGLNIREISEIIGASRISAAKYLDVLAAEGRIEVRMMGKAKMFYVIHTATSPSLLNRLPSMILVLGTDTRIIQANDQFIRYYSLTQEKIFGQPLSAVPAGILREPSLLRALDEVIRTGTPVTGLTVTTPPDNATFSIAVKPTPPANDRSGIIVIINEITGERSGLKDGSGTVEEAAQPFLERIKVPACIVQDGKIRVANSLLAAVYGCGGGEFISRSFRDFVCPEDAALARAWCDGKVQRKEGFEPCFFSCRTATGTLVRLECRAVPLTWKKRPASLVFCMVLT